MFLNRQDFLERIDPKTDWEKRLVVEPFFPEAIHHESVSASLDVHLGNRFRISRGQGAIQHDPLSGDPRQDVGSLEVFIPMGKGFSIHPGQAVLGTTLEWFRFPPDLMAFVIGRSIWGRRNLLPVTAMAVHPYSSSTITLELSNLGDVSVGLKPGVAIAQLFFHTVNPVEGATARPPTFSATYRPSLGKYSLSEVEKLLLFKLR